MASRKIKKSLLMELKKGVEQFTKADRLCVSRSLRKRQIPRHTTAA
jgi:hypothetical protein